MKTLEITITENNNIVNKIELVKELFDYNEKVDILEVRITGRVSNVNYGSDRPKYQLITIVDGCINYDDTSWDVTGELKVEFFIYEK